MTLEGEFSVSNASRPFSPLLNRLIDTAHEREKELKESAISRPQTSAGSQRTMRSSLPSRGSSSSAASFDSTRRPPHLKNSRVYDSFEYSAHVATETVNTPASQHLGFAASWGFAQADEKSGLSDSRTENLYSRYEVNCQFDSRFRESDLILDPGHQVYPKPFIRPGPLRTLYVNYARRNELSNEAYDRVSREMKGHLGVPGVHTLTEEIDHEWLQETGKSLLNMNKILDMCEDFDVMPKLLRRDEVIMAFKAADRGLASRPSPNNRPDELTFAEFADMLVRMALFAFSRQEFHERWPDPLDKVYAMIQLLDIHTVDTKELRKRLHNYNRIEKERKQRRVARKAEFVHAARLPNVPTDIHTMATAHELPPDLLDLVMRHDVVEEKLPKWKSYSRIAIDCGTVHIKRKGMKEERLYRIALRNRSDRPIVITVSMHNCPFLTATYTEVPLAAGVPRIIELVGTFEEEGEWLGHVEIDIDRNAQLGIPVYAKSVFLNKLTEAEILTDDVE